MPLKLLSWCDNLPIKFKDSRTFDFHKTFGVVGAIQYEDFNFDKLNTRPNQVVDGLYQACTAYTQSDVASNDDGVLYDDYEWLYRKTLFMMDAPFGQGCDMMVALKAATVYGVKTKQQSEADALKNRRAPYFIIKSYPGGDKFDGLISAMMVKQGCVSIATPWFPIFGIVNFDGTTLSPADWNNLNGVGRHDWEACGIKMIAGAPHIICKSWQGSVIGDKGYIYFSREQVNALLSVPGAGAFVQKKAQPSDIQVVTMTIMETLISYLKRQYQELLKPAVSVVVNPGSEIEPPKVVEITSPYQWDNRANIIHSIRVICDEEGLSWADKNIICACIEQESNFNTHAINYNRNSQGKIASTDYGLCQINDYYHIGGGKEFTSVDEVINNPEKSVRYMIKMMRAGHLDYWVSYTSGAYKKYL